MRVVLFSFCCLRAPFRCFGTKQAGSLRFWRGSTIFIVEPRQQVPQRMHFGIPFYHKSILMGGASGLSVYDIFGNTGEDINAKIERKIFEMKPTDFFTATQQLEVVNFGWRSKSDFYFSGECTKNLTLLVISLKTWQFWLGKGNADYLDYEFDLGELSTTGDLMTVFHFGANKQIADKLTVGLRAKSILACLAIEVPIIVELLWHDWELSTVKTFMSTKCETLRNTVENLRDCFFER